ncbi:hypothetical protein BEWA_024080 [Theileria equi strain WA]|uniref:Uncharacterized protein n=1 Tax=Theileria equi strain WA TaxID=1537102 RepID=L0AXD2_THEEQ|nr:hypothetical protein BEWA_024080 [Theileria equi strain WA]AFZ79559.1 hypothetical protein BEWA_024080 [Theileria equi strain WA]|eukprot:XP_004829225.1 hypothetical protein BEWA_024080 [Theileria equi strain WA]
MDWLKAALDASDDEEDGGKSDDSGQKVKVGVINDVTEAKSTIKDVQPAYTHEKVPVEEQIGGISTKKPEGQKKRVAAKREFNANRDFNINRVFNTIRNGLKSEGNSGNTLKEAKKIDKSDSGTDDKTTNSQEDKDHTSFTLDGYADSDSDGQESTSLNLFTIEKKSRNPETFKVDNLVKINVETCTEDEILNANVKNTDTTQPESQTTGQYIAPEVQEYDAFDYSKTLHSFNVSNPNSEVRIPKSKEWQGAEIHITDINAEDLRMSKEEKERAFSGTKEALMEGRKRYSIMAHRMETDDGHILTSNTVRRTQKRKHQINWLAAEAQDKEMEIMERTAHMRKSKHEARMKYGW